MTPLSNAVLCDLPSKVALPTYDRTALTPGIVHIGLGNFHRAHQSWYLHRLMTHGLAHDWAIIGAGVRPYDQEMRSKLAAQDYLTTLIALDPAGVSAEVTGAMIDYVPVQEGHTALIDQMVAPQIRIVSLTVTEGGYYTDPATGRFDANHPDIRYDIDNPNAPRTAFGAIIAALGIRRDAGGGPFTLQSCDNLQGNGDVLRQTVTALCQLIDPALAAWIGDNCSFPNSMVDCIVPATGPAEIALAQDMGIADAAPVTHERFRQWVMEDDFCAGRPDWDVVGATFSDDVKGYEAQKIRMLNAGHQIIAAAAEVMGLATMSEAMAHPTLRAFFEKVEKTEILPHVTAVPGMTPSDYLALIADRFSNPKIVDTIRRIAFDGSSRHPGFVLPTVRDALRADAPLEGLALVEATWARMCAGTREDGSTIAPNDPNWSTLTQCAREAQENPQRWLAMRQIYGDLAQAGRFSEAFGKWLNAIYKAGVETTLRDFVRGT